MAIEFDGHKYRKASSHQKSWGRKIIAELQLTGHERVLDIGCGDGLLTAEIAAMLPWGSAVGIDQSQGMIDTAKKLTAANLVFELLDVNEMEYDTEFDLVLSNAALHWVTDHRSMLGKVHRCLKPGGRLRFNFAARGNCANFFRVVTEAVALPRFAHWFEGFQWPWYMPDPDEYKELVGEFEFSEIQVWGGNEDTYFPDAAAIAAWVDQPSLVPLLEVVGQEDKKAFRDWVVENLLTASRQPDGRYLEPFKRVNLFAVK